jgi:hypothetical protein
MCWSAAASLNTFLFSVFGFAIGVANGHVALPTLIFTLWFSTVQLAEYFVWSRKDLNSAFSKVLFVILALEPIFAANMMSDKRLARRIMIAYIVFLLVAVPVFASSGVVWKSAAAANRHLNWLWLASVPAWILILWSVFLLLPFYIDQNWVGFVFGVVTLAISLALYYRDGTFASMWCWIATMAWLYLIWMSLRPKGFFQSCLVATSLRRG